jgi:hypothetical protein
MANPNIISVTSIYGNTAYIIPTTSVTSFVAANGITTWTHNGTTALTGLTPAAGTIHKVGSVVATNVTGTAASCYLAIGNNPVFASSTAIYYLAYNITVPTGASLVISDKAASFYITENQSLGVFSGTANALHIVASFEVIT